MTSIILQGTDLYLRSQETNNITIAFLYVCMYHGNLQTKIRTKVQSIWRLKNPLEGFRNSGFHCILTTADHSMAVSLLK